MGPGGRSAGSKLPGQHGGHVVGHVVDAQVHKSGAGQRLPCLGQGQQMTAARGRGPGQRQVQLGLRVRGGWLEFDPALPSQLDAVSFTVLYRGQVIRVCIDHHVLELEGASRRADDVTIHVHGAEYVLKGGQKISVALRHRESRRPEKATAALRRRFISDAGEN